MRLDQELVHRKLCESRTEAQGLISSGVVFVNDVVCTKQIKQISEVDIIRVISRRQFVSRGGEKLQGILRDVYGDDDSIKIACSDKVALDIGSSTGGFTDCLLFNGVSHVDAVDVGTFQLHEKIRKDKRVSVYENTDIRKFNTILLYDIIVVDLSFIPISYVIDDIIRLSSKSTQLFLLIKPQFEVGKGNTKKGIVKDDTLVKEILEQYKRVAEEKWVKLVKVFPSCIQGGDGNQEYFLYGIFNGK